MADRVLSGIGSNFGGANLAVLAFLESSDSFSDSALCQGDKIGDLVLGESKGDCISMVSLDVEVSADDSLLDSVTEDESWLSCKVSKLDDSA
jgi:hypothetical protein